MKPHVSVRVLIFSAIVCLLNFAVHAQTSARIFKYTVSMNDPGSHYFHVVLQTQEADKDTVYLKMPKWMPGYYQIMDYAKWLQNFSVKGNKGKKITSLQINDNTWRLTGVKNATYTVSYDIKTQRQFVATSYIDSAHAYIIPEGVFLYEQGGIKNPVSVKLVFNRPWNKVATGLEEIAGKKNEFMAPDFDILYDCPILIGNLEELPSFKVHGIEHRFIGYNMGDFDKVQFMSNLKKAVTAASDIIGNIPYKRYTFIAIGNGRGGIEHLNNTTVSFNGKELQTQAGVNKMMSFLSHEYFHNYNVKRIRPFELGPFDYDKENRTNLLWVSEGLSVYYEYLVIKRSGIIDEATLYKNFESNINAFENDPGRTYQSLVQASYETWSDGPFGRQGQKGDRAISYYDKGPVVGLFLDFAIRHFTDNKHSLDDVMRLLYNKYYKQLQRGFTDAEFQEACETVADTSLSPLFEYVYTTKDPDYNTYLGYAGLTVDIRTDPGTGEEKFFIHKLDTVSKEQEAILHSWLGDTISSE